MNKKIACILSFVLGLSLGLGGSFFLSIQIAKGGAQVAGAFTKTLFVIRDASTVIEVFRTDKNRLPRDQEELSNYAEKKGFFYFDPRKFKASHFETLSKTNGLWMYELVDGAKGTNSYQWVK